MIGSALVDRARIVSTVRSDVRVEGSYQTKTRTGPWFRCRFDPGGEGEQRSAGGVRRDRRATLLVGRRAIDGTTLSFSGSDVIEVDSRAFGLIRMQLQGLPEVVQKRRSVIGWIATLERVDPKAAG